MDPLDLEIRNARSSLAFALDKYPERVELIPLSQLVTESARQNEKRPAYVKDLPVSTSQILHPDPEPRVADARAVATEHDVRRGHPDLAPHAEAKQLEAPLLPQSDRGDRRLRGFHAPEPLPPARDADLLRADAERQGAAAAGVVERPVAVTLTKCPYLSA